jgi:methanogenic corrinoid protein MtbC1
VVTPTRSDGGQRLYSQQDVERLTRLRRLTDRGHAIGHIASLDLSELARLDEESAADTVADSAAAGRGATSAEESVRDIAAAGLRAIRRLDSEALQAILERAAVTAGVPAFLDGVVVPMLEGIGRGWQERSVSIAQEHLASAVIRRVLGWLLGVYQVRDEAPRLIVATPPGQVHELGALMVAVSAAAEGWAVTYLGTDLPVADLVGAARETDARAVAISVVYVPDDRDVATAVREARAGLPARVPLLLGGSAVATIGLEPRTAGILVMDSLAELRAVLRQLGEDDAA